MFPLIINILLDHFKIDSNSRNKVSSRPETLLGKHLFISEPVMNQNCWFSFEFSHDISHGILGSYPHDHMNMIWSYISFDHLNIESFSKLLQYSSEFSSDSLKKNVFSVFWNYHDVECTVPLRVWLGIIGALRHNSFRIMPLIGIYTYSRTYEYTQTYTFCEI